MAFALLGAGASRPTRPVRAALAQRLRATLQRVFLTLALLVEVDTIEAVYLGYCSRSRRTRAHALDLLEACVERLAFGRLVLTLLESHDPGARLRRAAQLALLPVEVFSDPRRALLREDDPELHALLLPGEACRAPSQLQ